MGTKSNSNIKAKLSRREDPRSTNYPVLIFVLWEVGAYVRRKLSLPTDKKYQRRESTEKVYKVMIMMMPII